MADWRQIQARIRKAKTSSDSAAQLTELYERTRDAMVAFELAVVQEKAGDSADAVRWYTTAAERFRRPQWRTKAEEALTRLGAPIPERASKAEADHSPADDKALAEELASGAEPATAGKDSPQQIQDSDSEDEILLEGNQSVEEGGAATPAAANGAPAAHKRRRRGRRGGRRHRGQRAGAAPAAGTAAVPAARGAAAETSAQESPAPQTRRAAARSEAEPEAEPVVEAAQHVSRGASHEASHGAAHGAAHPATQTWQGHARAGEPALASRMAALESQLRRLLACPLASLEEAERAPAGPGVLLLSDSDQQTHYYIESCQTLRIGIGNLLRGGRGGKDSGRLKESMAENLGITEARVPKYLKDHCIVRWLQLDEGMAELAHFAIAVLRPQVNE
jgi:hypothetical protein